MSSFWRKHLFILVIAACVQFIILTTLAMLFYQGGTLTEPTVAGYSFFTNFFSELGMTVGRAGQPNTASRILFMVALTLAGIGLILFFTGFIRFFHHLLSGRALSIAGTCFGVIAGLGFIGIAFAPSNVYGTVHRQFVMWTFRMFPLAVLIYAAAIFCEPDYQKRYAWVFIAFGVLLVVYVLLITLRPGMGTAGELAIQVTGQKVIAYASVITILIQAIGAQKAKG